MIHTIAGVLRSREYSKRVEKRPQLSKFSKLNNKSSSVDPTAEARPEVVTNLQELKVDLEVCGSRPLFQ